MPQIKIHSITKHTEKPHSNASVEKALKSKQISLYFVQAKAMNLIKLL